MQLSQSTFRELAGRIQEMCGLDLGPEKLYLVRNRLEPIVRHRKLATFEELARRLGSADLTLRREVIEAITTHETAFFRDGHPFETFRTRLLPRLAEEALRRGGAIRIWSAACSTGQEAYSLAILLREWNANPERHPVPFVLLATDVSPAALARAEKGEYTAWETSRGLTATQLRTHFQPCESGFRVVPEVRRLVQFRTHNLLDPVPPPGLFDMIICRNVLIYFDEPTRARVLERFREALPEGGLLLLGAAENLIGANRSWEAELHGATLLYRRGS
jgi:chemotaxis protein methyltransferase CheR